MRSLCLVITGLSTGGAETMLLKLLQHLDRTRFAPHVVSLTTKGEIGPKIEALGIPVLALGMRPDASILLKFVRLQRLLRQLKPDVVHTWMYHADLLGGLAARLARIRAVSWGIRHSNLSPGQNKRGTLLVMKACALLSDWVPRRIMICSARAGAIHAAAGYRADKLVLLPNGFDLTRFRPDAVAREELRAELGLAADTPLVGLIARDDPQKNHLGFVDAAVQVHRRLPQVHFVLAGAGIDRNHACLGQAIAQAVLHDRFHMLGRRDDVPRLMAALDVLASSSFGEAFPNVLGEAMASGVPCVVTDVGDCSEIVGDTGRVVAAGDMRGLADRIVELLAMPSEARIRLGACARERVRAHYEIGDVTRRYEAYYTQLLAES